MRKSFLLYVDTLEVLNALTDEQAGQLFRAVRAYHVGEPYQLEPICEVAMTLMVQHFKRDAVKYDAICERNRMNGKKQAGSKREANEKQSRSETEANGKQKLPHATNSHQKNPVGSSGFKSRPNGTDNDNDNDNDSDSDSTIVESTARTSKSKSKSTTQARPTLEEVQSFFKENGYSVEIATKAYHYYAEAGWKDSRGEPVRAWKQKMRGVWFRDEHKPQAPKEVLLPLHYNPAIGDVPAVWQPADQYRPV